MAYNKAREEKKWRQWKEAEEKELRRLGVSEDVIARLHEADWDAFKVERRYSERNSDTDTYIDWQAADEVPPDIRTVQNLLDEIDNEELYRILLTEDKLTLQIAIWKMEGYTNIEIAKITGIPANAVNVRIWRLKQKIKNIL
ncbi:sigma-70 family RNA polymerase sigma factor [Ruminococcaceae bacterium OttesenSCG-928-L11]|nr:sigma-70 family RNA polymerase sigma factor [Ruminococcaceae bacterium OttesenSCG-928-L11]